MWVSSTGDYFDMKGGDKDDDSFDREIAGEGLNAITWMAAARDLVITISLIYSLSNGLSIDKSFAEKLSSENV
jgi:hypothetical protein